MGIISIEQLGHCGCTSGKVRRMFLVSIQCISHAFSRILALGVFCRVNQTTHGFINKEPVIITCNIAAQIFFDIVRACYYIHVGFSLSACMECQRHSYLHYRQVITKNVDC